MRACTSHWFEWEVDISLAADYQDSCTLACLCSATQSSYVLAAAQRAKQGELSSCFSSLICGEKWHIIYSLLAVMELLTKWQSRAMEPYQLSYLHYEYGYYQCLVSRRLILWFSAAEKLSGMVGFLSRQLVRTKTCLIFSRTEMLDSWSWTKRIYCGLMFHWAREKPQTLSHSYSGLSECFPRDCVWG